MPTPVLIVLAGPNGAGKTTLFERVLGPATNLEFVNADRIAAAIWPGDEMAHAYEAAQQAAARRAELIDRRLSFVAETVFSHPSKIDLMRTAIEAGYQTSLHVVLVPEALAVARVENRVEHGGHDVPAAKIRERYARLWGHLRTALSIADDATVYDNSRAATPFVEVARFVGGRPIGTPNWPAWTPTDLTG